MVQRRRERVKVGGIEYLTTSHQIQNDFINTSCCFQKKKKKETSLEENIVQMLECVGGGCRP